jgi:hypothetical protein
MNPNGPGLIPDRNASGSRGLSRAPRLFNSTLFLLVAVFLLQGAAFDPLMLMELLGTLKIQILLGIILAFLFSMAVFHRRFPRAFERAAIILATTILALLVLELASLGILSYAPGLVPGTIHAPGGEIAGRTGYEERFLAGGGGLVYAPYTGWQARPGASSDIGVGQDGNRLTPGGGSRNAFRVFLFGGSALWGRGVPDSCTIAAYLQAGLDSLPGRPVDVENFAQIGWTSTQSLVKLVLELQAGNVPDFVIFYDGVADAEAAYAQGMAGSQQGLDEIDGKLLGESRGQMAPSFMDLVRSSSIYTVISGFAGNPGLIRDLAGETLPALLEPLDPGVSPDSLAADVTDCYFENLEAVGILSRSYGFRFLFVWQPAAFAGNKLLCGDEVAIVDGLNPSLADFYRRLWQLMWSRAEGTPGFVYLGGAFEQIAAPLFIDASCMNSEGNRRVAGAILQALLDRQALAGR